MSKITLFNQSRKTEGTIKVRFRLTDGRKTQLYHRSEIDADLADLLKFEVSGNPKNRANYNRNLAKKDQGKNKPDADRL